MSQFFIKNFYKQRADFTKEAAARDKKLSFPEGVIEQKDIRYLDDRIEAHRLDIFRPADRDGDICHRQRPRRRAFARQQRIQPLLLRQTQCPGISCIQHRVPSGPGLRIL